MKGLLRALIPPAPCLHCHLPQPEHLWLCEGCRATLAPDGGTATTLTGGLNVESAFFYGGACSALIPYAKDPVEPPLYAWLVAQAAELPNGSALVPVPTHWRRRIERGGCHTTALARALSAHLDLPVVHALERSHLAPKQSQQDRETRRQVRPEHFRCRDLELPPGKVLLIDDVLTTGATLSAAARALLQTHALDDLGAWVLARRPASNEGFGLAKR
ncbi:MAG: hypothetical protein CMH55_07360 [Myxococcales bacterium]|nr:hypothetical protein [Myxococcales bacterium]|tara:strand:- start:291 stop:941 length:651 start_codon:yes stop_codon:yes gene_type:complete